MNNPHFEKTANTVQFMVDGKPFLALSGELHNSTASSAAYAGQFWGKLKSMNLNTVILGVSWGEIEPEEDVFHFEVVDELVKAAHAHGLKLMLIWFATWKNAASTYPPEWVKTDLERFSRVLHINGHKNAAISCFNEACCLADAKAFAALMRHLKETDLHHTVIALQVQNECGVLGTARDYSEQANRQFAMPIPQELATYLKKHREELHPYLLEYLDAECGNGNWKQVFHELAEEVFMCYYTARFINRVAEAGKAEYGLPMFVNGWPEQCEREPAGLHPSGGPTSQMLDIWRCAAPALDVLAGDLYLENFVQECAAYTRLKHNPLFIPEARKDKWVLAHAFYAFANHDAICFSPFGIEEIERENYIPQDMNIQSIFQTMTGGDTSELLGKTYGLLANLMPTICRYRGTGKMKGILQDRLMDSVVNFSHYTFRIKYKNFIDLVDIPGGGMMIELNPHEFLVAGMNFSAIPVPCPGNPEQVELVSLEEGHFEGEQWICDRVLNGDELHIVLHGNPKLFKIRLFNFQ